MKKALSLIFAGLIGLTLALPASAAGYNLTVYTFTGSPDKTVATHKALAGASVTITNYSPQITNSTGETTFTNVPPSTPTKKLKISVSKSGCTSKVQSYVMPKYNAKVGIQMTCSSR